MNSKNRSFLFFFLVLFTCWNNMYSQSNRSSSPKTIPGSFIIHGDLSAEQMIFFTRSIEAADFEQYRLQDAPVELDFKNGFKLELLSAKDLTIKNKNQNVNPNSYSVNPPLPPNKYPVFEILNSGWITAEAQTLSKKN
jgi:hypothetical protein